MANKNKRKRKGGSGRPAGPTTEQLVTSLTALVSKIEADLDNAGPLWGEAQRTLVKLKADPITVGSMVATRDIDALRTMCVTLASGGTLDEAPVEDDTPPDVSDHSFSSEDLRHAFSAFKKRLKLTRLDHESKLSVSPMTGGKSSDIDAIMPPREYPADIWDVLVDDGRLRRAGRGFYELSD